MAGGGLDPEELTRVGFGCYRVDVRDSANRAALELALASGCNLIDTASNYSDGRAEELVGSVLSSVGSSAFVITKVGYVSPAAAGWLESRGRHADELDDLSEHSKYSIDPDVIRLLLDLSRARLGRDVLDAVLLHNPEHLISLGMEPDEAALAIRLALEALGQEIDAGRLRYCGVSSNAMGAAEQGTPYDFDSFAGALPAPSAQGLFIEFPLNLVERGAATARDRPSLLSRSAGQARRIANRPLNAQLDGELVRLAATTPPDLDAAWRDCVGLVAAELVQQSLDHAWEEFRPMQFLRDNLSGIGDFDLIDAIWRAQVEPFLTTLFGMDPPPEVRRAFGQLRQGIGSKRRQAIEKRGLEVVGGLVEAGALVIDANRPLAQAAVKFTLDAGADHVVVGMRDPAYVRELTPFFQACS